MYSKDNEKNVNGAKNCTLQLIKKYMFNFERNLFKKRRVQFFAPLTFIHLSYWIKIVQPTATC